MCLRVSYLGFSVCSALFVFPSPQQTHRSFWPANAATMHVPRHANRVDCCGCVLRGRKPLAHACRWVSPCLGPWQSDGELGPVEDSERWHRQWRLSDVLAQRGLACCLIVLLTVTEPHTGGGYREGKEKGGQTFASSFTGC